MIGCNVLERTEEQVYLYQYDVKSISDGPMLLTYLIQGPTSWNSESHADLCTLGKTFSKQKTHFKCVKTELLLPCSWHILVHHITGLDFECKLTG